MVGEGVCMAGGMCGRAVCGSDGMHGRGVCGGRMWQGACVVGEGVCMEGGHACQGSVCGRGRVRGGRRAWQKRRPLHSCCYNCFVIIVLLEKDLKQQFLLLRFLPLKFEWKVYMTLEL